MGLVVRAKQPVREASRRALRKAHEGGAKPGQEADAAAERDASDVEKDSREVAVDWRVLAILVLFLAFIVVAGIVTEQLGIQEWGERLVTVFNTLWPLVLGYVGGEYVAEKTK
jgi:hypothetical protein